jgi:hypothetical protein
MAIVEKACVGKTSCAVKADRNVFGDPCYDVVKTLAVELSCPAPSPAPSPGTYSLVDGVNFCYETTYTDANYQQKGWKSGKCAATFNTIVSTSHETICQGHSEENIKYCPKTEVTILVTKKGVGGTPPPSPSPSPTSFLAYFAKELQGGLRLSVEDGEKQPINTSKQPINRLSVEDGTPNCLHCVGSYLRLTELDYSNLSNKQCCILCGVGVHERSTYILT